MPIRDSFIAVSADMRDAGVSLSDDRYVARGVWQGQLALVLDTVGPEEEAS